MKFVLADTTEFDWPVKIKVPSEKTIGQHQVQQVTCRFRTISKTRQDEIELEFEALQTDEERMRYQIDMLGEVLIGWDENDFADKSGENAKSVPFNDETKAMALANPFFRSAAYTAYANAISGEARRGN